MCATVFIPCCHRSVSLRRKLLHHANVAISLLSTRPPSSHSLSNATLSTDTSHQLLQTQRHTSTTLELSIPACGKTAIFPPPASALSSSSCEVGGKHRQAKPLKTQPSTAFLLAKLAISYCAFIHLTIRISAPLPMALRLRAVRLSEGAGDRGISAESLRFPSSASHEHPSSPVQLVYELWRTRHVLEPV